MRSKRLVKRISGFCRKFEFSEQHPKIGSRNSIAYRLQNSRKRKFATELNRKTGEDMSQRTTWGSPPALK
jgi:hypothetical protein